MRNSIRNGRSGIGTATSGSAILISLSFTSAFRAIALPRVKVAVAQVVQVPLPVSKADQRSASKAISRRYCDCPLLLIREFCVSVDRILVADHFFDNRVPQIVFDQVLRGNDQQDVWKMIRGCFDVLQHGKEPLGWPEVLLQRAPGKLLPLLRQNDR